VTSIVVGTTSIVGAALNDDVCVHASLWPAEARGSLLP
jgi:hypothetical protein